MDKSQHFSDQIIETNLLGFIRQTSHARELEQIVQQALHLLGCIIDTLNIGLEAQQIAASRIFLDKAKKTLDGNQGRLQIVRNGIGEVFQFGILCFEFLNEFFTLRFHPGTNRYVSYHHQDSIASYSRNSRLKGSLLTVLWN